jgi:hypothetical protein
MPNRIFIVALLVSGLTLSAGWNIIPEVQANARQEQLDRADRADAELEEETREPKDQPAKPAVKSAMPEDRAAEPASKRKVETTPEPLAVEDARPVEPQMPPRPSSEQVKDKSQRAAEPGPAPARIEQIAAATPPQAQENQHPKPGYKCSIATAAYGSYLDPHVETLRQFRDRVLLTNPLGAAFVDLYYQYSPPMADYISRHESLRTATRWILTPIVCMIVHPVLTILLLGFAVCAAVFSRRIGNA